jgi:hypothetical protein
VNIYDESDIAIKNSKKLSMICEFTLDCAKCQEALFAKVIGPIFFGREKYFERGKNE